MKWKTVLHEMKAYKPGRSIEDVKKAYQLQHVVKLASNENPYGCSPLVKKYLTDAALQFELYPDGYSGELRRKIATKHGVEDGCILFGNGSDEIISIIAKALLKEDSHTIMATPTFPQYAHNAVIQGAAITEIPLCENGEHDLDAFLDAIQDNTAVIWICNPNNPTGTLTRSDQLQAFLQQVPADILVVLDEAYYEYVTEEHHLDVVSYLEQFPQVIVLRTFSKAYGLAAIRLGYGIAHEQIVQQLNKVRNPFNNNSLAVGIGTVAIEDQSFIDSCRLMNAQQRKRFYQFAAKHSLHIYPSETNFVLMAVPIDADEASEKLLQRGYIVRSGNALGTPGYIRITVGSEQQNSGFLQAFEELLEEKR